MTLDRNATNECAALKALAHPTRLQIVTELLGGTKRVTDIQEILSAYQSVISQHLKVLLHARLVDFFQDGAQRFYYVSRPRLVDGIVTLLTEGEPILSKSKADVVTLYSDKTVVKVSTVKVARGNLPHFETKILNTGFFVGDSFQSSS